MIVNGSFEVAATYPGTAADWSDTSVGTAEESASFGGDSIAYPAGSESFDHGWGNDPQVFKPSLGRLGIDFERLPTETMDRWLQNTYFFVLSALESVGFDAASQTVEDFSNGWGSFEQDFVLDPTELFQGASDDFEWVPINDPFTLEGATFGDGTRVERFELVIDGDPDLRWVEELT